MSIRKRRHRESNVELDLTAFMNLMVIMIPSLLVNAVFTQVNVLNVDQPGDGAPQSAQAAIKPTLTLDVEVFPDKFVINNRGQGQLADLRRAGPHHRARPLHRRARLQAPAPGPGFHAADG